MAFMLFLSSFRCADEEMKKSQADRPGITSYIIKGEALPSSSRREDFIRVCGFHRSRRFHLSEGKISFAERHSAAA